jgi:hypothetical protein
MNMFFRTIFPLVSWRNVSRNIIPSLLQLAILGVSTIAHLGQGRITLMVGLGALWMET